MSTSDAAPRHARIRTELLGRVIALRSAHLRFYRNLEGAELVLSRAGLAAVREELTRADPGHWLCREHAPFEATQTLFGMPVRVSPHLPPGCDFLLMPPPLADRVFLSAVNDPASWPNLPTVDPASGRSALTVETLLRAREMLREADRYGTPPLALSRAALNQYRENVRRLIARMHERPLGVPATVEEAAEQATRAVDSGDGGGAEPQPIYADPPEPPRVRAGSFADWLKKTAAMLEECNRSRR